MRQRDLFDLAMRLEADEKMTLRYSWPLSDENTGAVLYEERADPLLDVAEESGVLFVYHNGDILKVLADEAIEVLPRESQ